MPSGTGCIAQQAPSSSLPQGDTGKLGCHPSPSTCWDRLTVFLRPLLSSIPAGPEHVPPVTCCRPPLPTHIHPKISTAGQPSSRTGGVNQEPFPCRALSPWSQGSGRPGLRGYTHGLQSSPSPSSPRHRKTHECPWLCPVPTPPLPTLLPPALSEPSATIQARSKNRLPSRLHCVQTVSRAGSGLGAATATSQDKG